MVALLVAQRRPEEALVYAERAKARVLLDVIRAGRANITKAMTPSEREQENKLRQEISTLNAQAQREAAQSRPDAARLADLRKQLDRARLDLDAFTNALYSLHPELKLQRGDAAPSSLAQTSNLLKPTNTALVEYVIGDEQTYLFVITGPEQERVAAQRALPRATVVSSVTTASPTLKVYTLNVKRSELNERVERFRRQLAERDLLFADAARALYNLLLAPASEQLQGKKLLTIVPDGALWELPFQALQTSAGRYVLEEHAISYSPSLSVLREMASRRRVEPAAHSSSSGLVAFGNPSLSKATGKGQTLGLMADLGALPDAERQVKGLAQIYGAANSTIYTGTEAREDRLKAEAGKYRILHLAAHGVLNDVSPMYSYIALAQDGTSNLKNQATHDERTERILGADRRTCRLSSPRRRLKLCELGRVVQMQATSEGELNQMLTQTITNLAQAQQRLTEAQTKTETKIGDILQASFITTSGTQPALASPARSD
jgi:CHAT domain-containing protein